MGILRFKPRLELFTWDGLAWAIFAGGLVAILGAQSAHAGNEITFTPKYVTPPAQMPVWTDTSKYVECGQDCLYAKGNANITMQSLYIIEKIKNLQKVFLGNGSDDYREVVNALSLYCPDRESGKDDTRDSAALCLKRYIGTQVPILRQLKAALISNDDSASRLKSNIVTVSGGGLQSAQSSSTDSKVSAIQDESPGGKLAQVTDFQKEGELLTAPALRDHLNMLASDKYQEWADSMVGQKPQPEEFAKTEQYVDPESSKKEKVTRFKRKADGSLDVDTAKYTAALQAYEAQLKGLHPAAVQAKGQPPASPTPKPKSTDNLAQAVLDSGDSRKTLAQEEGVNPKDIRPYIYNPKNQKLDDVSYNEARNIGVKSETGLIGQANPAPKSPARSVAQYNRSPVAGATSQPNSSAQSVSSSSHGTGSDSGPQSQVGFASLPTQVQELNLPPQKPEANQRSTFKVSISAEQLDTQAADMQKFADSL